APRWLPGLRGHGCAPLPPRRGRARVAPTQPQPAPARPLRRRPGTRGGAAPAPPHAQKYFGPRSLDSPSPSATPSPPHPLYPPHPLAPSRGGKGEHGRACGAAHRSPPLSPGWEKGGWGIEGPLRLADVGGPEVEEAVPARDVAAHGVEAVVVAPLDHAAVG